MYDAVIQESAVLPNGVKLAAVLAGSLVRDTASGSTRIALYVQCYVLRSFCQGGG